VQRGLCNGSQLGSRAEYSQRRSSILDPDISKTVRNIQEPSTLGEDRVLLISVSRKRFGTRRSRTLDGDRILSVPRSLGGLLGNWISVLVVRYRILASLRAVRPVFIPGQPITAVYRQRAECIVGLPSIGDRRGEGPVVGGDRVGVVRSCSGSGGRSRAQT